VKILLIKPDYNYVIIYTAHFSANFHRIVFAKLLLIFEENRDLFINPDDFSMYVLFRTRRDYNYESREQLWDNLAGDLKVLSSITLYKSEKNYQVILLTHEA